MAQVQVIFFVGLHIAEFDITAGKQVCSFKWNFLQIFYHE